jgi:hypothetical protein
MDLLRYHGRTYLGWINTPNKTFGGLLFPGFAV